MWLALAQCHGNFGHGSLAVGIEQFCAVENHAVVFLTCTGKEAGNVNECYQRNIEGVAEADEACALARGVAVEYAGEEFGLVGHDTYRLAVEAGEAYNQVLGIVGLYFEEFAVVDDSADNLIHVVGFVGRIGDDVVEAVFETVDGVVTFNKGSLLEVVLRNVAEEFADNLERFLAVFGCEVTYTALL